MESRKKKTSRSVGYEEETEGTAIACLGEVLLGVIKEANESDLEIFERYSNALQEKIYRQDKEYLHRLQQGYRALITELQANKNNLSG